MKTIIGIIITMCCYLNIAAQNGKELFPTIFPLGNTSFTIESKMNNHISYSRYEDHTSITKIQNKTLEATEFHNSKRHIFTAKYLNYNDSTIVNNNNVIRTNTINTDRNDPTFIDKMYQQPINKTFNLYIKETGEGYASLNADKLTNGAEKYILPSIKKGLANLYLKSLDYTYNEDACFRLVESAMVMPHEYNWEEEKIKDTVNQKTESIYVTTLHSVCGLKADFEIKYKIKKISEEKYTLIGTGYGVQHFNEEKVSLWIGEGKMFSVNPKDITVNVEIEVDRMTGLVSKAIYKTSYHHTANEETSPGKPNDLVYDVIWNCENIVSAKK